MPSSLYGNVQTWAHNAISDGKYIVWINPAVCGGDVESRKECRRITVTFSTLVAQERGKLERKYMKRGQLIDMPVVTPFENVVCKAEPSPLGGFQVVFHCDTHPTIQDMYQSVDPDTGEVQGPAFHSRLSEYMEHMAPTKGEVAAMVAKQRRTDELRARKTGAPSAKEAVEATAEQLPDIDLWAELPQDLRNDPNDIPEDVDPFA